MVSVELVLEGVAASGGSGAGAAKGGSRAWEDLVATVTSWWITHALDPFQAFPVNRQLSPMTFTVELLGAPVSFGVRYDENLLPDLLEAYTVHGWAAIELVENRVAELGEVVRPTLDFLRATRNAAAVIVADALIRLEGFAVEFARERWQESRQRLHGWLSQFFVAPTTRTPVFEDVEVGENLVVQCRDYAALRGKILHLQQKIDERNRVVPAARRVKGSGADLWFEIYATPQRELLPKLAEQAALIAQTFPSAVLVLDALPAEVLDLRDELRRGQAVAALARAIHSRLSELTTQLDYLLNGLDKPFTTAALAPMVDRVRAGDVSGLAALRPPKGGYERQMMESVLERTSDDDQRLLADLGLLLAMQDAPDLVEPGSIDQITLFRYVELLAAEVDRRRTTDAAWDRFWTWLERISAALALIALMAFFPFGAAAAPALVTALTLAGTAAAVIGVVVLVLHQVVGSLQDAGELDRGAWEQLFRLGQDDPEALTDIAQAMDRSRALRSAVASGALLTVLTLGAQRRIRVVARAMELQGIVADVETAFHPADDVSGDVGP